MALPPDPSYVWRPMRNHCLLIAATFIAMSCGDTSGPVERPGLTLVSGNDLTDTVYAKPVTALVVEVRDDRGAIVPQGTIVRFTAIASPVASPVFLAEMYVEGLTSTYYDIFAAAATDAAGHAAVLVQMGRVAGPGRIAVSVPTLGLQDTARYTVLPGRAAAMTMLPSDTSMYTTGTYTIHASVVDQFNNPRNDPVVYSASAPGVSISSSGVVTASAIARYTVTGTAGSVTASSLLSVVPQGTVAAVVYGDNGARIVTFNLDGTGFRDVVGVTDGGIDPHPRWIPGTSTIIYTDLVNGLQQLRTVDASGNVSTFFPSPPATMTAQAEPSPSANAPVLYFSAYDSRCSYYYLCLHRSGIDGASPELLGNYIAPDQSTWHPSPSPDGSKVAFVMTGPQIKVFDYTSKTVSAWSVTGNYPAWSPDGTQIAFGGGGGGPMQVINADGTNQRSITSTEAFSEWEAAWSPDSKWIIALDRSYFALDLIEVATGKTVPLKNVAHYTGLSWK